MPVFFVWVDEDPRPSWTSRAKFATPLRLAVTLWKDQVWGLVLLLLASFEACLALVGLVVFKRVLRQKIPQLQAMSVPQRDLFANLWWYPLAAIVGAYIAYLLFFSGRDVFRNARGHRVTTIAVGALIAAGIWSFGVMPAVANQFSPKGVFATYRAKGAGAPIALLGVNVRTAAYELANVTPQVLTDARSGHDWLNKGDFPRKYLALKSDFLPELNRLWREKSQHNVPILDGRSAQILLAEISSMGPIRIHRIALS